MAQYCRYCIHLATGNGIWCGKHEKILSESYAKCPNRCKDFDFCEIDAFMENHRPYRPRSPPKKKEVPQPEDTITENQISLF